MEVPTLKGLELNSKVSTTVTKAAAEAPKIIQCKSKKSTPNGGGYGTGKRKDAVARVWVKPGKGTVTINKKDLSKYFARESYRTSILRVFADTNTSGQFDVVCTTKGGGTTGQAGAIIHGIARALDCISEDYHAILRQNGFLTRDSRTVERKKYGRRKARKKVQFSKR
ncbi:MAG: 30S ribosomal protein S9 [Rickettsiaceae bacterium]|nr:30S ribosomal protein S9 [Rickettsiaceae bacterium]MDP4832555.1 30S ribosomal protein S9 [Rickettsiaceae bacterium]MDP5020203.1 30S ribosomal protein S9 [Rickettsiaceae bacterium]MDP5082901.1 30S ribosomal protein S9 [Rickettsiaceae bacterium]